MFEYLTITINGVAKDMFRCKILDDLDRYLNIFMKCRKSGLNLKI